MALLGEMRLRTPGKSLEEATAALGKHWGWLLAIGIAYVVLGVVSLTVPWATTLGLTFALAGFFVASGILMMIHAIRTRREQGALIRFLQSILALALGAIMFWWPGLGMLGITLALSFYFLVDGALHWIFASAMAPGHARRWTYVSAITAFVLGVYIIMTFPISALWVPGILLGINFLTSGAGLIGLAFTTRKLNRAAQEVDTSRASPSGRFRPSEQPI